MKLLDDIEKVVIMYLKILCVNRDIAKENQNNCPKDKLASSWVEIRNVTGFIPWFLNLTGRLSGLVRARQTPFNSQNQGFPLRECI